MTQAPQVILDRELDSVASACALSDAAASASGRSGERSRGPTGAELKARAKLKRKKPFSRGNRTLETEGRFEGF